MKTSFPFTRVVPSLFATVQYAVGSPIGAGVRLGVELRGYLGASVTFTEHQRSVSIANNSLNFFLGGELPWGSRGTRSAGSGR